MNDNPLFSVLIANYNNGKYLEGAIKSILDQTYKNWEIIVVDDGSTDNSKELYKLYTYNKKIKIFYNEKNEGIGYSKRKCVEHAEGELCGFLDPDDILLPKALELMTKIFLKNSDTSLIFSRMYLCDNDLNILSKSRILKIPNNQTYFTTVDYNPEHFVAFSKRKYDLTEGISSKYLACVDLDLYFKLEEVGKFYILNEFTYKYRTNVSHSITNNIYKDHFWGIIVKYDTAIRRGLNPNHHVLKYFKNFVDYIYKIGFHDGEKKVSKSKSYRIGKFITTPYSFILHLQKKKDL
jgi:glycosyltransferase involved in cell wall biosynthesis